MPTTVRTPNHWRGFAKFAALVVAGCTALYLFAGCGKQTKGDAPEPTPNNIVNGTNTQVIRMPDGFRNVAFTCYGPNGVYVTSRGTYQTGAKDALPLASSVFVLPNDPHCAR